MIKLRLSGKAEEIAKAMIVVRAMEHWKVLNESGDYFDRAPSRYVRRYIDVDLIDITIDMERDFIKVDKKTGEVLS